jgi:hypothetical protein
VDATQTRHGLVRATKKTTRKKAAPSRTRWRRVACPRPEPTPVPTPRAPEWVDDERFISAWRSLFPSRERDDAAEARRALDLLTAPPPFARGQGKPKRRRASDSRGLRLLSDEQIEQGKAHYGELLDKDQKSYRKQQTAAKEVTAFLGLLEESWQTVEDQIVVPVLRERKLKPTAKAKK